MAPSAATIAAIGTAQQATQIPAATSAAFATPFFVIEILRTVFPLLSDTVSVDPVLYHRVKAQL